MSLRELAERIAKCEGNWESHAACRDLSSSVFFPERGQSTRKAKQVCRGCEVRTECLAFALESRQKYGIWGGLTGEERRAYMRRTSTNARRAKKRQELEEARETYGKPGHVKLSDEVLDGVITLRETPEDIRIRIELTDD